MNNTTTNFSGSNLYYSYQQHFQVAINNFDTLIREERLLKRMRKSKDKFSTKH
jgi:hypothetical protein